MRLLSPGAAIVALLLASPAGAQPFPARSGESGIIDVPDAAVQGAGRGMIAAELRFDHFSSENSFGPLPLYAVAGLSKRLDLGLAMREGGQPGDALPSGVAFGAAVKLSLWGEDGAVPGAAFSAVLDRFNAGPVAGGRIAFSSTLDRVRLAAFAGAESSIDDGSVRGATFGGAMSILLRRRLEVAAEALTGPRGGNIGLAVRAPLGARGISLGANYFPADGAFRIALTIAASSTKPEAPVTAPVAPPAAVPEPVVAQAPAMLDDRPHFRLRLPTVDPLSLSRSRIQYAPPTLATTSAPSPAAAAAPGRAAAPSLDELAEAQVREQEALADTRARRIGNTGEQLEAREKAALDEQKRLADRERELTAREQQLDARGRAISVKAAPTQQQRQLESLEAQLASQERSLAAQERSYGPALDAAQGRAREASTREETERQEVSRLAASASGAASRAQQVEIRKQATAARNRQLAALEGRLVAKGEYIDALERVLRTKAERLDAFARRLDARSERLDLIERLTSAPKAAPAAPKPTPTGAAGAPKGKAAFVMVVKSPTAIVKEAPTAPGAAGLAPAVHSGVAVEKAVVAATVLMFPTPTSQLSEIDVEGLVNIARLAAKERCELLIWARAKDQTLMGEAQRRATEIQTRTLAAAPLDAAQVVTRITVRPGARGVDVVVSALRDTSRPAGPAEAAPTSAATLLSGESGKRQIRESVLAAQPAIEACIGEHLSRKRLLRADGVLRLTVSTKGRVVKIVATGGDLSGGTLDECLGRASAEWVFPSTDAEYVVDVPITVVGENAP